MKEFRKIVKVHPLILYKEDLIELENILKKGLSLTDQDLNIKIGMENSFLNGNSFEELFTQSLPKQTDYLSINAYGRPDGINIIMYIRLTFYHNFIDYQISSSDETWFLGMISQLNHFFTKRKPWYSWLNKSLPIFMGGSLGLAPTVIIKDYKAGLSWSFYLTSAFFISVIVIGFLGFKQVLFPYVRVFFSNKLNQKLSNEKIAVILNLAILIATIFSIVIPLIANK